MKPSRLPFPVPGAGARERFATALIVSAVVLAVAACGTAPATSEPRDLSFEMPTTGEEHSRLRAEASCGEHRRLAHAGDAPVEPRQAMQRELLAYQSLVEEALSLRARAVRVYAGLRDKADRRVALSGKDLQRLNEIVSEMLELRAGLFRVSYAHECWLDDPVPDGPEEARIQATGIAISLSAALVLYDNYISVISLYRSDTVLRQHVNRGDRGFAIHAGELTRIAASFASEENRARVRRGLAWFEAHGRQAAGEGDSAYRYLVELIEQSPARQVVRARGPVAALGSTIGFFSTLSFDTLFGVKDETLHMTSLLFGNTVGLVEIRRGKLDGQPHVLGRLRRTARAGDILLEKTPFRLTDVIIPGHWGHAAVWIGTESELRELGIWEHPIVRAHHDEIREGRGVVEALRSGVQMNTLGDFLNVDDLALLRQDGLSDEQRAGIIVQALRQVGKAYDFNFDVETTDRIVCSELVYHAYGHLDWPTSRMLGRVTVSPDNIAVRATGTGPLRVAALYHDGAELLDDPRREMERLVNTDVVRMARR